MNGWYKWGFSFLFLSALLCVPPCLNAQEVEVKRERTFTGTGLYGYMNGGAEQFLEYGVTKLVTRDVVYQGEEFTVDIYDLPSPEEAFGIYSLHIFRCQRADTLGCIDCLSRYQLQAAAGNRYVSVVFPSGSAKAERLADELIRLYIPLEGQPQPEIPEDLRADRPYSGRLKYLKGPISLSGVSASLAAVLKEGGYKGIWFVSDKGDPGSYRVWIDCKSPVEKESVKAVLAKGVLNAQEVFQERRILREGKTYLYLLIREKEQTEEEEDGGFGF